jgi:hypothetical protein
VRIQDELRQQQMQLGRPLTLNDTNDGLRRGHHPAAAKGRRGSVVANPRGGFSAPRGGGNVGRGPGRAAAAASSR